VLPTLSGVTTMLDVGATVDCKPKHLVQFASWGDLRTASSSAEPQGRPALDRRGGRQGNDVIRETFSILKRMPISFIGNVDGKEV
jgi:glycerol-3-phosphate acyltransferase PlsX